MSYSMCKHGGSMCDGCMDCYDRRAEYEDDYEEIEESEEDDEEEEE